MSSDRSNAQGRPVKPTLASTRTARTPLAPRLPTSTTASTLSAPARRTPAPRSEPPPTSTPRPKLPQARREETPTRDDAVIGNVTPRSSARKSRVESTNSTPSQAGDSPNLLRPRVSGNAGSTVSNGEKTGGMTGLSAGYVSQGRTSSSRPKSVISDGGSLRSHTSLVRSAGHSEFASLPADNSIDSRFFHASDVSKAEPAPKRPTAKKSPTFFYADGRQDERSGSSSRAPSPVLSAVSEQRSIGPWAKSDLLANPTRSNPLLSPNLASLSGSSPFFNAPPKAAKSRSPSPSKENIHLSYRKGASQIFGPRPTTKPPHTIPDGPLTESEPRRIGSESKFFQTPHHRKTPSLSSIDSGSSQQPRRRSATTLDPLPTQPSPLSLENKSSTYPKLSRPPSNLPSIDTTFDPSLRSRQSSAANAPQTESTIASPTKPTSELAADARRERKVLDLEISNSSLLAINSSLEREVRRQKAELKRFRRLSRAGRFSVNPDERAARFSEGLSVLGEEEEDEEKEDYGEFGPPSGFTEVYDDFSDDDEDEDDEDDGNSEPLSPSAQDVKQKERLVKDEKRLRVDLEKHKELLVQSQMMNQSLKRCTFATETMIKDGRKALDYKVRVADIKLGGRILTGEEQDDGDADVGAEGLVNIEVEDEDPAGVDEQARGFLDMWQGLGSNGDPRHSSASGFASSEGGDRDSGIEVEKPAVRFTPSGLRIPGVEEGRPPDETVRVRPAVHWTNTIS